MNREDIKELYKEIYSRSYYEFYKDAFRVLHPGVQYSDNWHAKLICDKLQKETERIKNYQQREKDLIINVPFRSSKSLLTTVIWPVWCWTVHNIMKFITTSYSADLSLEHATLSRNLIESLWFKDLYGDDFVLKEDEKAKGFYKNKHTGSRRSVSIGGQITGSGADVIIVDDPQNPKLASSEVERKNTINYYDHTLFSRLNDPEVGMRIIIMQRLHEGDLTGHLLANHSDEYEHICLPAEITENTYPIVSPKNALEFYENGLFWPTRFNKDVLNTYFKALGATQYAGQLQQLPAAEEGNMIKKKWFEIVQPENISRDIIVSPIYFYLDTAETEKTKGDLTGICACFKKDNVLYFVDIRDMRKEFFELNKYIVAYTKEHKYTQNSMIKIEPKSNGKSIVSQLKHTTMLNVVELKAPDRDKIIRVASISPLIESGRVKLIKGLWNEKFLNQICTFPNATNDDMVDCFTHAVTDMLAGNNFDFGFYNINV